MKRTSERVYFSGTPSPKCSKPTLPLFRAINLPRCFFKLNRYLKGSLRIIKVKYFAEEHHSVTGICRPGWQLFHLEADRDFLQSLRPFPEDHLFPLESSGVIIRGGSRTCARKKDLPREQAAVIDQHVRPPAASLSTRPSPAIKLVLNLLLLAMKQKRRLMSALGLCPNPGTLSLLHYLTPTTLIDLFPPPYGHLLPQTPTGLYSAIQCDPSLPIIPEGVLDEVLGMEETPSPEPNAQTLEPLLSASSISRILDQASGEVLRHASHEWDLNPGKPQTKSHDYIDVGNYRGVQEEY